MGISEIARVIYKVRIIVKQKITLWEQELGTLIERGILWEHKVSGQFLKKTTQCIMWCDVNQEMTAYQEWKNKQRSQILHIITETPICIYRNTLSNHFFPAFFAPVFPAESNITPAPSVSQSINCSSNLTLGYHDCPSQAHTYLHRDDFFPLSPLVKPYWGRAPGKCYSLYEVLINQKELSLSFSSTDMCNLLFQY